MGATEQQKAFALYRAGCSTGEIAAACGVSGATVRGWKSRGRWGADTLSAACTPSDLDDAMIADVEENETLTNRQRAFCLHYVRTFNATQAAIRASYSPLYAGQTGYNLLCKPHIAAEIRRLKHLRNTAMLAGADDIVQKYMEIAFADLSDFMEWGRGEADVPQPAAARTSGASARPPQTRAVNDVRLRDSSQVDGTLVCEVKVGRDGASVKLPDKLRALEWLGKYFELHPGDAHRRNYDARKLELELLRTQARLPEAHSETLPDDGFLAALNAQAQDAWPQGWTGDCPHAQGVTEADADAVDAADADCGAAREETA